MRFVNNKSICRIWMIIALSLFILGCLNVSYAESDPSTESSPKVTTIIIGDSYGEMSFGGTRNGSTVDPDTRNDGYTNCWTGRLSTNLGLSENLIETVNSNETNKLICLFNDHIIYSASGRGFSAKVSSTDYSTMISELTAYCDPAAVRWIIVGGGANDTKGYNQSNFISKTKALLENAHSKYPNAKIVLAQLGWGKYSEGTMPEDYVRYGDWDDMLQARVEYLDPDLRNVCDEFNYVYYAGNIGKEALAGKEDEYFTGITTDPQSAFNGQFDPVHPNYLGEQALADCLQEKLTAIASMQDPCEEVYYLQGNEKISLSKVGEDLYLFLPSEADATKVRLHTFNETLNCCFSDPETSAESETIDVHETVSEAGNTYDANFRLFAEDWTEPQEYSVKIMKGNGIGAVYFDSKDPEKEGRTYIDTAKENLASGTAFITDSAGNTIYDGKIKEIHARGNSSFRNSPKKSYQIKLDKKTSLIEGTEKAKTWILNAQYLDPVKMSDKLFKDIAQLTCEGFSPAEGFVNLYYDGEYRGVYLLSEKVQINSERINIHDMEEDYTELNPDYGTAQNITSAENAYGKQYFYQEGLTDPDTLGGFLLELNDNATSNKEANYFWFSNDKRDLSVNIKSPEFGSQKAVKYISEYFQEFENAVRSVDENGIHTGLNPDTGMYYYDYCDLDSLVDAYMLQMIGSNADCFRKSQYFYKDAGDSKMYAGPIWDMDLTLGTDWYNVKAANYDGIDWTWTHEFMQIPSFRERAKERYFGVYQKVLESILDTGELMPSFSDSANIIHASVEMDYILWPEKIKAGYPNATATGYMVWDEGTSFDEIRDYRINWIREHKDFMDQYFANIEDEPEPIIDPDPQAENLRIYGSTRYETAIKVADKYKETTGEKIENVIVAYGENFPDALAGGYLAKVKNAPILLVKPTVENQIADYISNNIASGGKVYILGETGVVGSSFESKVKAKGIETERLGGKTRYDTNLEILKAAGVTDQDILVCTALDYADSLSASATGLPILLVDKSLKDEQVTYLKGLRPEKFFLIGGTGAVDPAIETELKGLGYSNIERLAGDTRYETSIEVAKKFFPKVRTVMFAYAKNFPDGLSGGPLAMINGSPIILTDSNKTAAAREYVKTAEAIRSITLGGVSLIPDIAVNVIMGK